MVFQYLESTLHTLVVAISDKPQTSLQVVRNSLCENGIHEISESVYWFMYYPSKIIWRSTLIASPKYSVVNFQPVTATSHHGYVVYHFFFLPPILGVGFFRPAPPIFPCFDFLADFSGKVMALPTALLFTVFFLSVLGWSSSSLSSMAASSFAASTLICFFTEWVNEEKKRFTGQSWKMQRFEEEITLI